MTLSENNEVVKDCSHLADILNEYFISIAEYTVGRCIPALPKRDIEGSILKMINKYEHHISIVNIKKKRINSSFGFKEITYSKIRQLLTELNPNKPMGIDMIPPQIVIMLKDDIRYSMQSIANMMIDQSTFLDQAKISSVTPAFKKDGKMDRTNYRPISVLPCLSKILEKVIFEQMADYFESIFFPYLSGFRKRFGCQHILMRMTENWRKSLDHKKVIGALSMNLISKVFDSLQHDTLIAKLHAMGLKSKH